MRKILLILCLLLFGVVGISSMSLTAQGAPEQIQDALALFNQDTGQNLTLNDLYWTWEQLTASDSSLGCPKDGEVYTQVTTVVYRFLFTWQGNIYDYRVSADRTMTRACSVTSESAPTPTLSPNTTATPDPFSNRLCTENSGTTIAYPHTRLTVGIQGHVPLGDVSRVRADPSTSGVQVGEITGGQFEVLAGPVCDTEGYLWWQINDAGLTGWIAEGKGITGGNGEYYIEPLPPSAALTGHPAISLANAATVNPLDKLQGNFSRAVRFAPDGKLVTVGDTGSEGAWIYDTLSQAPRLMVSALPLITIGFDQPAASDPLALFGGEDGAIRLWDIRPNIPVTERVFLRGHDDPVSAVAFKTDGALIASSGGLAYTTQNDAATDTNAILLWDVNTVSLKTALRGHTDSVTGIVFMPDGTLVSASLDGSLRWWDGNSGTMLTMIQAETAATSVALSPDGSVLVAGYADGSITAYRPQTGTYGLVPGVPLSAHAGGVTAVAFSPDGQLLVSVGQDGKVILWDAANLMTADNQTVVKFILPNGHNGAANGVAFSPDGTLVASIGVDHFIWLWAVNTSAG